MTSSTEAMKPGCPILSSLVGKGGLPSSTPPQPCHPERSAAKSKDLRWLLPLLLLVLAPLNAQTHFNGQAAYTLTQQLLTAAPKRFNGSPGHQRAEDFIKSHFKEEAAKGNLETDTFTSSTPAGAQTMRNYIVKFPGKKPGIIVLASHYETNYNLRDIDFVGANDGAATSALLIEIGTQLRAHPPEGASVWLLFDDGEESVSGQWSDADSLYGTRHLAARWANDGTLPKIKAFIVADMCADKDLNIDYVDNSTPWLLDALRRPQRTPATPPTSSNTVRASRTTICPSSNAASPSSTSSTPTTAQHP